MKLDINGLTPAQFLAEYWQKKPLVIRQGFSHFQDLVSPEALAGLAMEELVESRRVYQQEGQWQAEFGPFESYDHLGEKDWTLIVQALNNWVPDAEALIQCFDFIPRWRLDDVMVSFATPGGGVGPHIDLYDVFICQGSGRRRWRVGNIGPHKQFVAHPALLHTESFEPIIDTELLAGDILYIPPGFPHEGVTLEQSLSFSVGYRTASAKEMVGALADHLSEQDLGVQQISDPDRALSSRSGCVDNTDLARLRSQLTNMLSDELVSEFTGRYLTQSKCALDLPDEPLDITQIEVLAWLDEQPLIRLGGLRCLYFDINVAEGAVYINGDKYQLSVEFAAVIPLLCDVNQLDKMVLAPWLTCPAFLVQLTEWINLGYWYFDDFDADDEVYID